MQAVKSVSHATLKYKNYILTTPSIVYYFAHIAEECLYAVAFEKQEKYMQHINESPLTILLGVGEQ